MVVRLSYIQKIVRAGGCLVVVAQWQSTGCTTQVSWVVQPVTSCQLITFLYFCLKTSKLFSGVHTNRDMKGQKTVAANLGNAAVAA